MNEKYTDTVAINAEKTSGHPCFNCGAKGNARIHLPVAPACNIQCNYCVRKFDCVNESRPGVVSMILSPEEAAARYKEVKKSLPNLTVAGVAGPGDPLANFDEVKETYRLIRQFDSDVIGCLSTNGLMLPFYANELIALGISHVTVTVNTVNAETGAKIYDHVTYLGKTYYGVEGASILLQNQMSGIRYLASKGIVVKVNIVLLKGINDDQIKDITKAVKECGCTIVNIMQLIPVKTSAFEYMELVSNVEHNRIRKECESILPQMYHCKQCRADAVGTLENDLSYQYSRFESKKLVEEHTTPKKSCRFAICSKGGVLVDQHFGQTTKFYIYDIVDGKVVFVENRTVAKYCGGPDQDEDDEKIDEMIETIKDCNCVLCMRIGTHPSHALAKKGIEVYITYNRIDDAVQEAAAKMFGESYCGEAACR